ncbi:ribonuclease H-like domain-containing protein [Tanacetum coccineum]|uniref:Ribonuclease H-like domain-containing protein n=1 Tax=Tanacetum coccineum TaxID=301880 RepID=A0ABQ4Y3Y6_9ASTR
MAEYSQKWHNETSRGRSTETSDGLTAIQAQLNNLGLEIKKVNEKVYVAQVGCEQCKGPDYTKDCPQKEEGKTLEEEERTREFHFTFAFINDVCFDNALVDLGASVSVMPLSTYLNLGLGELAHTRLIVELADRMVKYTKGIAENVLVEIDHFSKCPLRVGEENIIFKSVKPTSSVIKRVYMLSLRERMELDLEARLMEETLVLNRSLDPFLEDYIKLNDLNEPFELRRNQGDDLMPTIEEGDVIEEFRTRDEDLLLEDMDAYRDKGMGDIIVGEPFLREVGSKAKRFEGIITLYNGDDEVTYQMVRSHPKYQDRNALVLPIFSTGPREGNIEEYWWRI